MAVGKRRRLRRQGFAGRGTEDLTNNLIKSSCDFLGRISSIWGASRGYVSMTFVRMPRWTEDLTLDFAPAVMLLV